ncbi:TetR/AcrR family transcriptional regulator [Agromyces sp. LHK192]|uniref:TetR/AcrR family transcriptional regulator n=1 Tax=Agromyces sp. LHK192 TaxID=2498704 RepID=UPI000FDB5785|nr:TetR/AcrR family transcriptional regulator [Agromyces sp. LHK192]
MPKVTDEHRTARREEILDAAVGCFMLRGYTRTSIADIVEASGLSAGAIYGNFPGGKGELFASVAARVLEARRAELVDRRSGSDVPLAPGELMATIVGGIRGEPFSGILPQLWAEALIDPEIHGLVRGVFERLKETIRAQLAEWAAANPERIDGDPGEWARRVAPVVLSAGPGFILQRALLDDFDEEAFLAALPTAYVR